MSTHKPTPDEYYLRKAGFTAPEPQGSGMKYDGGKVRMELLVQGVPRALEAVGEVLTFGAEKYAAHSWRDVENARDRYWGAKLRHEIARAKGEHLDPESGLSHLAHEACSLLFLLELETLATVRSGPISEDLRQTIHDTFTEGRGHLTMGPEGAQHVPPDEVYPPVSPEENEDIVGHGDNC